MSEKKVITNPVKAIRAYCIGCVGSSYEVKNCPEEECELWSFRFGKNPFRAKRELTEEQKRAVAERFAKARERKKAENAQ